MCSLVTDDDIIICDPEAEYGTLVERLNGQVIHISPTSTDYVNPMDLNLNYSDDENPLSLKSDFILSLCELIVGGKEGLQPVEKTIIDRCVRSVYREYLGDPTPEKMPILGDLYNELRKQEEKRSALGENFLNMQNHASYTFFILHRLLTPVKRISLSMRESFLI